MRAEAVERSTSTLEASAEQRLREALEASGQRFTEQRAAAYRWLATKLTYGDGSARYDGRTDPHHHARCLVCGAVIDVAGEVDARALAAVEPRDGFRVEGFRLEVIGRCVDCAH